MVTFMGIHSTWGVGRGGAPDEVTVRGRERECVSQFTVVLAPGEGESGPVSGPLGAAREEPPWVRSVLMQEVGAD